MPEKDKKEKNKNNGTMLLIICSILTLAIIIGCVFFPNEIFGIFKK